jgi:hypothetical protein
MIGTRQASGEAARDVLGARLDILPGQVGVKQRFPLGFNRGLRFGISLHPQYAQELCVEGTGLRQIRSRPNTPGRLPF